MEWRRIESNTRSKGVQVTYAAVTHCPQISGLTEAFEQFWMKLFEALADENKREIAPPIWDRIHCHLRYESGLAIAYPLTREGRARDNSIEVTVECMAWEQKWHDLSELAEDDFEVRHAEFVSLVRAMLAASLELPAVAKSRTELAASNPFKLYVVDYDDMETMTEL